MKKSIKIAFTFICMLTLCMLSFISIHASGTALTSTIGVTLEQQESSSGSIRYISTISNVDSLDDITSIKFHLSIDNGTKSGSTTKTISTVYTQVTGTNGKSAVDNTYYAVVTITGGLSYKGYTLEAYFEYTYSDSTEESTNVISYTIPTALAYTVDSTGTGSFESVSLASCFQADSIENGNIFHAWNWHLDTITANLENIYNAGYTAVQTSPVQPQKDYYSSDTINNGWWKLYQPLGFSIATKDNAIGTKTDLTELCSAADTYGIKVIVDIVSNHLAAYSSSDDSAKYTLHPDVATYEPDIYGTSGTYNTGALLHSYATCSDGSIYNVVRGNIGMPDLDTSSTVVQNRVISLLEECLDCGVDGFRFDAAKHIETPSDGEYASNFWPNVLGTTTSYASTKGYATPYYYGEILSTPGTGRAWSYYTSYMDLIDNATGNNTRSYMDNNTASSVYGTYDTGLAGDQVVVWAESHDTYTDGGSYSVSQTDIDKAYAFMGSRNGAKCLYLARPSSYTSTIMGTADTTAYKSDSITAVNKFRNYWGTNSEWISYDSSNNIAEVVRYNGTEESGVVLINANDISSSVTLSGVALPSVMLDGTYTDLVSGNTFTVSSGYVSGTMASSGIAVLYNSSSTGSITISDNQDDTFYSDTLTVEYTIANASSATMTINGEDYGAITSGATLTFGSDMVVGDTFTVEITADTETETFTYTKVDAPTTYTVTFTKPDAWADTVYAYMWNSSTTESNATWPGEAMTASGDTYTITYTSDDAYDYIIFSDGTYQSNDVALTSSDASYSASTASTIYFKNTVAWSTVYAYCWNSSTSAINAAWPGVALSKDSTGYYAFDYDSTYDMVIFNNNSVQTANLTLSPYIYMYDYDGSDITYYYNIAKNTCDTHTWDSGTITTAATCTTAGVKTYTCTVCGATYTEEIAALGHDYDYDSEPTWVWSGYTSAVAKFACKNDSTHYDSVAATITSETVESVTTYTASVTVSGKTYTDTKVDDGSHVHDYTHVAAKAATCTTAGNYEYYYCEGCDTYFDADYNETTLSALTIAATGHTSVYNYNSTNHWHECSVCGEVLDTEEAHTFTQTTTSPTQGSYGVYTYTCSECGYSYTESFITLYFTLPSGWSTPYCYAYGTVNKEIVEYNDASWNGTAMTYSYTNDFGEDVYEITIVDPETYSTVIFNNGSSQTVDITLDPSYNGYYITGSTDTSGHYYVGTWYQS